MPAQNVMYSDKQEDRSGYNLALKCGNVIAVAIHTSTPPSTIHTTED